jgi:hypothetical protein
MLVAVLFASLTVLCGIGLNRVLRAPVSVAPFSGLATTAIVSTWCAAVGAPPLTSTALLVALALAGSVIVLRSLPQAMGVLERDRLTAALLGVSVLIPWLLLGMALLGVDAPISTHDGAFHVERVDELRRGVPIQGWYPMAFHASVAAVLRMVPWVDSARGTVEAAQALALLAPLGVFSLGLSLRLRARVAAAASLVVSLTYIYPYDDHMWGGWPLATSIPLLLGLWSVAARCIAAPSGRLAGLAGLLAGAIVLTHGTEVYSAVIGLSIIATLRWRELRAGALTRHAPVAAAGAVLCVLPYLGVLLGWAAGGGASYAGALALDDVTNQGRPGASGDLLEYALAITGAGSIIDLPLRAALLFFGARARRMRLVLVAWAVFSGVLFGVSFVDLPIIRWLYVITFPWLIHHRPPQIIALFASLLVGRGLVLVVERAWRWRARLEAYPNAWRRLAIVGGALLLFFAEGSVVSIFKTLDQVISEQGVYASDDRAAMAWLRQNAAPGEIVVNDQATDAGIWAPYKAGLPVLLPRSGSGALQEERAPILEHVADLSGTTAARACALHADYLYTGSRTVPADVLPALDRSSVQSSPALEQVFASGAAAVYRIHLACS